MNNLLQIREKINRANRLYEAQLLATKSGEVTPYRRSSLKKESGKHKKKWNWKTQKIKFFFETDQLREGFFPLFLIL